MIAPLLLVLGLASFGQLELPQNDGWVTDLAGLLKPDEERALEDLMESYRVGTKHEIALLTIPSLEGEPLERYALEVGRGWGIGGKDANDGALMLVARDERKVRIEVGRGLEGMLTDSIAGRIIREIITPQFKRGDYYGGIRGGIEAMHAAIGGDYGPLARTSEGRRDSGGFIAIGGMFSFFMMMSILAAISRRRGRGADGSFWSLLFLLSTMSQQRGGSRGLGGGRHGGGGFGGGGGGGFGGFGGGGGFSGGGASGGW